MLNEVLQRSEENVNAYVYGVIELPPSDGSGSSKCGATEKSPKSRQTEEKPSSICD